MVGNQGTYELCSFVLLAFSVLRSAASPPPAVRWSIVATSPVAFGPFDSDVASDVVNAADAELPMVAELLTILLIIDVGRVDIDEKLHDCILPHIERLL